MKKKKKREKKANLQLDDEINNFVVLCNIKHCLPILKTKKEKKFKTKERTPQNQTHQKKKKKIKKHTDHTPQLNQLTQSKEIFPKTQITKKHKTKMKQKRGKISKKGRKMKKLCFEDSHWHNVQSKSLQFVQNHSKQQHEEGSTHP